MTSSEIAVPDYENSSKNFRHYWTDIQDTTELAKKEMVNMIVALKKAGYSQGDAIKKIIQDHKDLKGFSRATIYRGLSDEFKRKYEPLENNMLPQDSDVSNETLTKVIEDSSTDTTSTQQQQKKTTAKFPDYVEGLRDSNLVVDKTPSSATNDDTTDAENTDPILYQWQFRTMLSLKDQEIPVIVTVYHERKTGIVEVDEKLARKLKGF